MSNHAREFLAEWNEPLYIAVKDGATKPKAVILIGDDVSIYIDWKEQTVKIFPPEAEEYLSVTPAQRGKGWWEIRLK